MKPLIVIAGPTAAGKTRAAISAAEKTGGEIISADSMQIYEYMDIGTAKPTREERSAAVHHMIDIIKPDDEFSVFRYQSLARACIDDCHNRGKIPILCGGTGFYINAVLYDTVFDETDANTEYRQWLYQIAAADGHVILHSWLKRADPASYEKLHPNDVKRVIRALEYYMSTGGRISDLNESQRSRAPAYDARVFILYAERPVLYEAINRRTDKMFADGLIDETTALLARGYTADRPPMRAIGYKEATAYLNGEASLRDTTAAVKQATRHYAKRQLTWFKWQMAGRWMQTDEFNAEWTAYARI